MATWPTTSSPRGLIPIGPRLPESPRPAPAPLSRNMPARSGRESWSAGNSPNKTPVASRKRQGKGEHRGVQPDVAAPRQIQDPHYVQTVHRRSAAHAHTIAPASVPATPPAKASTRLSARSCLTRRTRRAPNAARKANSRPRDVARAISRLATLAQAINSTKATAPRRMRSKSRTPCTSLFLRQDHLHDAAVDARMRRVVLPAQHLHFGARLRQGRPGPQTGEPFQQGRAPVARGQRRPFPRPGKPHVHAGKGKLEAGRQHAGNRIRFGVQHGRLPGDPRIRAEPALPQRRADHHHVFLIREEAASHQGRRAQNVQEIVRNACAFQTVPARNRPRVSHSRCWRRRLLRR